MTATQVPGTLGLVLLVALVVGPILGSGIFGLPQNMGAGAGALGHFYPAFGEGNTLAAIVGASIVLWGSVYSDRIEAMLSGNAGTRVVAHV